MTGRATIGGRTRIQVVWAYLRQRPGTCIAVWRYLQALEPCTQTAVDKTLRTMFRRRYLTRHLELTASGQRQYVYAATAREPELDGRCGAARRATAAAQAARQARDYVDPPDDVVDDWPGERCVRKGQQAELPSIPTLAQLLAR